MTDNPERTVEAPRADLVATATLESSDGGKVDRDDGQAGENMEQQTYKQQHNDWQSRENK